MVVGEEAPVSQRLRTLDMVFWYRLNDLVEETVQTGRVANLSYGS